MSDKPEWKKRLNELAKENRSHLAHDFRIGAEINTWVDSSDSNELREEIAKLGTDRLGCLHPLLDLYRMAVLARHKPHLDDWPDEWRELMRDTVEAVRREIEGLKDDLPLRAVLLLDSLERSLGAAVEWRESDKRIAQIRLASVRETAEKLTPEEIAAEVQSIDEQLRAASQKEEKESLLGRKYHLIDARRHQECNEHGVMLIE